MANRATRTQILEGEPVDAPLLPATTTVDPRTVQAIADMLRNPANQRNMRMVLTGLFAAIGSNWGEGGAAIGAVIGTVAAKRLTGEK